MTNYSNVLIRITLDFHGVNGSFSTVSINHEDEIFNISPTENGQYQFEKQINLPTSLVLTFGNKDMNKDTIVDENGKIVKDKCVIIKDISLDNISCGSIFLKKCLNIQADDGRSLFSDYVGFNSKIHLNLDKSDAFQQLMKWKLQQKTIDMS